MVTNPVLVGRAFERRVLDILERNKYVLVKKNQWKRNYCLEKDSATKREYDLVMFNIRERQIYIIECKAHYLQDAFVGMDLVKEFGEKLKNNNGANAKRMMVTDTGYTKPANDYARQNNIILVDGKRLDDLEKGDAGILARIGGRVIFPTLESLTKSIMREYLKL